MSTYTITTTAEMSQSSFSLPNLAVGDHIITQGFYAANDGGAAEFEVKPIPANHTPDGFFEHSIYGHPSWFADLMIRDGIVYADQLGAKGDAVIPASYNNSVNDVTGLNNRTDLTITANAQAFNNRNVFQTALGSSRVMELRLTCEKVYAVRSGFSIPSNRILNGCGATIMNLFQDPDFKVVNNTIVCSGSASAYIENVEICNLRLIGNYKIFCANTKGVYIEYGKNIHVHDMVIERCNFGIHTTIANNDIPLGHANQVKIDHVHIREVVMGVQYNTVHNSSIEDSTISADFTLKMGDHNGDHCIYATDGIQNCVFRNLKLCNQHRGNGMILRGGAALSKDLLVENVEIDECRKGIGFNAPVCYVTIRNVKGTNIGGIGINFGTGTHILVKDSTFSGEESWVQSADDRDPLCGFSISSDIGEVAHIVLDNCSFKFPSNFFFIGQNRKSGCYDFRVNRCRFQVTQPLLASQVNPQIAGYKMVPGYIKGIISDIHFTCCRFETDGFTTETQYNGVFFYFDSALAVPNPYTGVIPTLNKMHWFFDKCEFVNNGTVTVNSPFVSSSANDTKNTVFCAVRDCLFHGFRWTIRVATINETQSGVNATTINPCFNSFYSSLRSAAQTALHSKQRFLSMNNLLYVAHSENEDPQYSQAEEFGIV